MDFFKHQDQARSRSGGIYLLFFLFVGILGLVNAALVYFGAGWRNLEMEQESLISVSVWVALITYAVIFGGTLIEWLQFSSGGGERVAEMLGGKLVQPMTRDPEERRLLNIVEEMAIASGTPVPKVYILEEEGVNAFAAGTQPANSVIGVTRGALNTFNRDEMQGVIAHEFSHILNGDVRRNVRLAALIFGVFCLFMLGQMILRSTLYIRSSRSSNDNGSILALVTPAIGLIFCVIGLLGQFFGRILQMAHSRQREFLADASAVQFTRDPSGIANALKKLGAGSSRLQSPRSSSMSHMFFGEVSLSGLLSSHPPLKERIKRVEPGWDGRFPQQGETLRPSRSESSARATPRTASAGMAGFAAGTAAVASVANASSAGNPAMSVLPTRARELAAELLTARLVIDSLLLAPERETQARQEQALANRLDSFEFREFQKVRQIVLGLSQEQRFPLLELTLPTLEQISDAQFQQLVQEMDEMIAADGRISSWEFLLRSAVLHHFKRNCGYVSLRDGKPKQNLSMPQAGGIILRMLVQLGSHNEKEAWAQAVSALPDANQIHYPADPFPPHWTVMQQAFQSLERAPTAWKQQLMQAGARAALLDGQISTEEMSVLRLVGMVTDVPVPIEVGH